MKIPKHLGIIPDGNRRWAVSRGLPKESGYIVGTTKAIELLDYVISLGIKEITVYGFTKNNAKRKRHQVSAFIEAIIAFAQHTEGKTDRILNIVGDHDSKIFPKELKKYVGKSRQKGKTRINILANYSEEWDITGITETGKLRSAPISRIDLVMRWGGRTRLSGFLPLQAAYADIYVIPHYWPDAKKEDFDDAFEWLANQDPTLGG